VNGQQGTGAVTLSISGTVIGSNGSPLPFSTASLRETGAERFSNERGEFVLGSLAPGPYHLRVKQLGFAAFDTLVVLRQDNAPVKLRVMLSPIAFRLATMTIRSTRACVAPDENVLVSSDFQTILNELRKNAERERLLVTSYPFEYRIAKSFDAADPKVAPRWPGIDTVLYRADQRPRYLPGALIRMDATIPPPENRIMVIPVLEDLGDPAFLRSHCFIYGGATNRAGVLTHRIDFKPAAALRAPDVEGSVFLDGESFVVRRAVFRLTRAWQLSPPVRNLEVTTTYKEVFPGVTVIEEVRSMQIVTGDPFSGRTVRLTERQRLVDYHFLAGQPGDTVRN